MTRSCHLYALVEGVESLCQRQLRPPWCNVPVCLDIFTPVELSSARRAFVVNCCIDPDLSLNLSGEPSWQLPSDPIFGRVVTVLNLLYFLTILCTVENWHFKLPGYFFVPFSFPLGINNPCVQVLTVLFGLWLDSCCADSKMADILRATQLILGKNWS